MEDSPHWDSTSPLATKPIPHFIDLIGSSTRSQAHAIGPYSTPAESSLRHTIQFILRSILILPSHRHLGLLPLDFPPLKLDMQISSPCMLHVPSHPFHSVILISGMELNS